LAGKRLIFLDEAGVNLGMSRSKGWAPRGEAPIIERPLGGTNVSLVGAICEEGTLALRQVEGSVDGQEFVKFLEEDLGPTLKEGDVVVMDGPRIHRVRGVSEALARHGATPLYLPAYSPEFNPIEMAWAWLKNRLRAAPPRQKQVLRRQVQTLWDRVTRTLCREWVQHCGYPQST
jgi:transposase